MPPDLASVCRRGQPTRFGRAFSLIEVVLAIGVVSFALLTIVGLLPTGLATMQKAQLLQATANIANQIRGQVLLLSFCSTSSNAIQQLPQTHYYYTLDGIPVESGDSDVYYTASFTTSSISASSAQISDASFSSDNAQTITVTVTYPPGVNNQTNTFSLLVARQTNN
jgi:uncharacterized protein (TIGR02598 family)